jgi:hypothetical protein
MRKGCPDRRNPTLRTKEVEPEPTEDRDEEVSRKKDALVT